MKFIRLLVICVSFLTIGCTSARMAGRSWSPKEYVDSRFSRNLEADIAAIENSEPRGWRSLASHAYEVDGEYAETFATACSYLARRDPTLFLRRHLAGDPDALFCAWIAYNWNSDYRPVFDSIYSIRLLEARSSGERKKIERFILHCRDTKNLPPRQRGIFTRSS
jgi:hypothetical protein